MTRDFIEITKDFDMEELYCLQSIQSVFQGLPQKKAKRMLRLIAQITQKYQLEIVKPNLDFLLQSFITPFDNYENAVTALNPNLT
jgi:hypothetical protein